VSRHTLWTLLRPAGVIRAPHVSCDGVNGAFAVRPKDQRWAIHPPYFGFLPPSLPSAYCRFVFFFSLVYWVRIRALEHWACAQIRSPPRRAQLNRPRTRATHAEQPHHTRPRREQRLRQAPATIVRPSVSLPERVSAPRSCGCTVVAAPHCWRSAASPKRCARPRTSSDGGGRDRHVGRRCAIGEDGQPNVLWLWIAHSGAETGSWSSTKCLRQIRSNLAPADPRNLAHLAGKQVRIATPSALADSLVTARFAMRSLHDPTPPPPPPPPPPTP